MPKISRVPSNYNTKIKNIEVKRKIDMPSPTLRNYFAVNKKNNMILKMGVLILYLYQNIAKYPLNF